MELVLEGKTVDPNLGYELLVRSNDDAKSNELVILNYVLIQKILPHWKHWSYTSVMVC